MTNYEYMIANHEDYVKWLLSYAIVKSADCPVEICSTKCPLYNDKVRVCHYSRPRVYNWLEEERKDD